MNSRAVDIEPFRRSGEFRQFAQWALITGLIVLIASGTTIVVTGFLIPALLEEDVHTQEYELGRFLSFIRFWVPALLVALSVVVVLILSFVKYDAYQRRYQRLTAQELRKRESELADKGTHVSFFELWSANNERIDFYHEIATSQSQASFRMAQITALVGFVLVIALGIFALLAGEGTAAIAASIIGVAAAGLSGYVGATFLKAQAEASAQLRLFFDQPVELARLLSTERLIEQWIPKEEQSAVVSTIIGSVLSPSFRGRSDQS